VGYLRALCSSSMPFSRFCLRRGIQTGYRLRLRGANVPSDPCISFRHRTERSTQHSASMLNWDTAEAQPNHRRVLFSCGFDPGAHSRSQALLALTLARDNTAFPCLVSLPGSRPSASGAQSLTRQTDVCHIGLARGWLQIHRLPCSSCG